jgi:hypothetical protein
MAGCCSIMSTPPDHRAFHPGSYGGGWVQHDERADRGHSSEPGGDGERGVQSDAVFDGGGRDAYLSFFS